MRRNLFAAGAITAALILSACGSGSGSGSGSSGSGDDTLTVGEIAYPTSFDVKGYSIAHQVLYFGAVYDTLLRQDGTGQLNAGLATEWSYDDDMTTLTLTLREGVTFTDGTTFDAAAVVANYEAFVGSSTADLSNAQYIEKVVAIDTSRVKYTLSAPDPMLLTWLTGSLGYQASAASIGQDSAATNPVGSGPYVLDTDRTVTGSTYVFTKNPDYWDTSYHVYDTLTIRAYDNSTALLNALRGNQLDAASFSDVSSLEQVEQAGYTVNSSQLDWSGLIFYDRDGAGAEALQDVRVRQAINYALDREGMLSAIQLGRGTVTSQVFGTATSGYLAELDDHYTYDVDKAKALLAEAGYADGLELTMPSSSLIAQNLLTTVQQQLAAVGITVKYTDTGSNFITDLLGAKFSSSWMQLASANDWQFAQLALVPNATFNMFGTQDDELDALFTTMQTGTADEAAEAAQKVNTYVTENAWFAPFYRVDNLFVSDEDVKVTMAADNVTPYLYLIQPVS